MPLYQATKPSCEYARWTSVVEPGASDRYCAGVTNSDVPPVDPPPANAS